MKQIGAVILLETYYEVMEPIDNMEIKKIIFPNDYENESMHKKTSKMYSK